MFQYAANVRSSPSENRPADQMSYPRAAFTPSGRSTSDPSSRTCVPEGVTTVSVTVRVAAYIRADGSPGLSGSWTVTTSSARHGPCPATSRSAVTVRDAATPATLPRPEIELFTRARHAGPTVSLQPSSPSAKASSAVAASAAATMFLFIVYLLFVIRP